MTTKSLSRKPKKARPGSSKHVRVIATNHKYGCVCQASINRLPTTIRKMFDLRAFARWEDVDVDDDDPTTIVVSRLGDVPEQFSDGARFGSHARHMLFVEELPVEAIATRLMRLKVRTAHRLHLARETSNQAIENVVFRVLAGTIQANADGRIADAWVEDDALVLLSPTFERMNVPLEKLKKRIGDDIAKVKDFEIDEDGSFLFWPHANVHLGWEQFQRLVDPIALLQTKQKNDEYNRQYGDAIRKLRETQGLSQAKIEGIGARNLRRVEHGQLPASTTTLKALANAHGMSLLDYLNEVTKYLA